VNSLEKKGGEERKEEADGQANTTGYG